MREITLLCFVTCKCFSDYIYMIKYNYVKVELWKQKLLFGTQESTPSFPMESCSLFTISQEWKHPLHALVFSASRKSEARCR